jgi:hypothetical protein
MLQNGEQQSFMQTGLQQKSSTIQTKITKIATEKFMCLRQ